MDNKALLTLIAHMQRMARESGAPEPDVTSFLPASYQTPPEPPPHQWLIQAGEQAYGGHSVRTTMEKDGGAGFLVFTPMEETMASLSFGKLLGAMPTHWKVGNVTTTPTYSIFSFIEPRTGNVIKGLFYYKPASDACEPGFWAKLTGKDEIG